MNQTLTDPVLQKLQETLLTRNPKLLENIDRIPAAVLIPLFEKNGHLYLLFTKRTDNVQHHRGEICFPGGSKELQDPDLLTTALREFEEEVSVSKEEVHILGALDQMFTVASNFLVTPFVGFVRSGAVFRKQEREVEELLEVPLSHLQNPAIFSQGTKVVEDRKHTVYYYQWQNHTIWGVTGRILKSLLDLMQQEFPVRKEVNHD